MSEDELREQLTKVITDAYMLGKSDQLMKLNDFAELSTGIIQKAHNLYERIALEARRKGFEDAKIGCSFNSNCNHCEANRQTLSFLSEPVTNLDNSNNKGMKEIKGTFAEAGDIDVEID